ncbi:uncharacterized protein LOC124695162 [Lolium rigidum]|uniref:uncharacterized protein LOC124695162 n=1 Tax=Lolium rigidum TaxID=89674 RepID=UPI001F5CC4B1|nr:uncharacterized protein LOC124695162 [Lolium rigidum]
MSARAVRTPTPSGLCPLLFTWEKHLRTVCVMCVNIDYTSLNIMATRSKKALFRLRPRLLQQRRSSLLAAALMVTLLLIVLLLISLPRSSPPPRHDIHTTSSPTHNPLPSAQCAAMSASLGEFGEMMLSMLPKDLAFTALVPSPESFRRVLKLRPNESFAEGKAKDDTYAVVSRVLGFSAVPRRLRSEDVPLRERVRLLDSVSGLKMYAWRDADGALVVNGVRSECADIVRDQTVVHVMAGVLMDAEFERSFLPAAED